MRPFRSNTLAHRMPNFGSAVTCVPGSGDFSRGNLGKHGKYRLYPAESAIHSRPYHVALTILEERKKCA